MTILGKILVLVNLVFSLVTAFLIVAAYSTRTNWKAGYDKANNLYQVTLADGKFWKDEVDKAKTKGDQDVAVVKKQVEVVTKERDDKQKEVDAQTNLFKEADARAKKEQAATQVVTEELNRRKMEVQKLQDLIVARDKQLNDQETRMKDMRDLKVAAEINWKSEADRAQRLQTEVANISRDRAPAAKGAVPAVAGAATVKLPPEDVEGIILETDAKSRLVTVSLGSDAGISPGTTLQVYRLKPRPEYVGTIKIVDAHHHESVATPVRAAAIQKGDIVASRIGGNSR
jgi:hypothetical protein